MDFLRDHSRNTDWKTENKMTKEIKVCFLHTTFREECIRLMLHNDTTQNVSLNEVKMKKR